MVLVLLRGYPILVGSILPSGGWCVVASSLLCPWIWPEYLITSGNHESKLKDLLIVIVRLLLPVANQFEHDVLSPSEIVLAEHVIFLCLLSFLD